MHTKKILLTSVCRPFGAKGGDASSVGYELMHKQVTRAQGIFSPRSLHVFFGLDYIAANLDAPAVVLHYPSRAELIRELKKGYDYVGLSFIMAVFHKMKDAIALIRRYAPNTKIVLGGYGTVLDDETLRPYGDYICREEGVAFFRRLLNEPELPMPYNHPLIVSDLKIFSSHISSTGAIFGGLGCPNGCDFCCTSHFFKRRHIRLLPTGKDIHAVIKRYWERDPNLVFIIFDEDFLLNKERALAFRDEVQKDGRLPSIFVFSSIKAISQYKVEEVLEMGIDGFWIGYEGTKSGYAKQQGRPVEDIMTEFREHGIIFLASMIVGFDYQDKAVVAQELDGLMRLKPSLSQFLIYGPVPSTPFYNRIIEEGKLQDAYVGEPEKFYRRADGFTTMIKHPTLSPAEIEGLQNWCFQEDFRRLGPSILRVVESWRLGYNKLKDSPNPVLRQKAAFYAAGIRKAYPLFLSGRLFGPTREIRRWVGSLAKEAHRDLGAPTLVERIQGVAAVGLAVWTWFKLKFDLFQHPRMVRRVYRDPGANASSYSLWEKLRRATDEFKIHVTRGGEQEGVHLALEGVLPKGHGEPLGRDIQNALTHTLHPLTLDLSALHPGDGAELRPLGEALSSHRSRIRLILPETPHPELSEFSRALE